MRPIKITPLSDNNINRLGGSSPDISDEIEHHLGYFFTVPHPVTENQWVSVFMSRKYDDDFDNRGQLITGLPAIKIVTHTKRSIRSDGFNQSELSAHGLNICEPEEDSNDPDKVLCHHKILGISTLEALHVLTDDTISLIKKGNCYFYCQIAFPDSGDDEVDGNWPVCDCLFALYYQAESKHFSAIWQRM